MRGLVRIRRPSGNQPRIAHEPVTSPIGEPDRVTGHETARYLTRSGLAALATATMAAEVDDCRLELAQFAE